VKRQGKNGRLTAFCGLTLIQAKRMCGNPDGAGMVATARLTSGGRHKHGITQPAELCGVVDASAATKDAGRRVETTTKKRQMQSAYFFKLFAFAFLSVLRNGRKHD
jgi:hypothetical protein